MKWDAVIFDLDGTLVQSIGLYEEAYIHALATIGITISHEDFWKFYWGNVHLTNALAEEGVTEKEDEVRQLRDKSYMDLLRNKIEWYPDAEPFLKSPPADLPKAVMTGSWQSYVDAIEEKLPLSTYFRTIVTTDDFHPFGKPHPHGLLITADRLGVKPEQCIYIGDQSFDVEAANTAGMTSCLIKREVTGEGAEKDAGVVIESLEELSQYFS